MARPPASMGIPTTKIYSFQLISPTAASANAAR